MANAVGEYSVRPRPIRGFREKACIPRGEPRGYSPAPLRGYHIPRADSIDHAAYTSAILVRDVLNAEVSEKQRFAEFFLGP